MSQHLTNEEVDFYLNNADVKPPSLSFRIKQGLFRTLFESQDSRGISNKEMAFKLGIPESDYEFIRLNPDSKSLDTYIEWLLLVDDDKCIAKADSLKKVATAK